MKDYDKGMCDAWRDEIEKLVIFAGLFSATVIPFTVDSYKRLQEPNPAASSVRINNLWLLSLIMCLSTVLFGILCPQWLRVYARKSSLASFDAITVRQMRLFQWGVPHLISFLPMALQVSVLLFFGGLLDLLWSLHHVVAAVATIAVGVVVTALLFTTIAPAVQSACYFHRPSFHAAMKQCPYKSPFSWLFLRFAMFVDRRRVLFRGDSLNRTMSWDDIDVAWDITEQPLHIWEGDCFYNARGLAKALEWTITMLGGGPQSDVITAAIFHSLHSDIPRFVAQQTLQSWARATVIGDEDDKVLMALRLDERNSMERKMQYDLLMMWFLQRYSRFMLNCDDILMELRLRCLNTLPKGPETNKMFGELLQDYKPTMASNDSASVHELHFQNIATILDYYRCIDYTNRELQLQHACVIGQVVAKYVQCTPLVNTDNSNASMCDDYEIHKRLARLLEDTRNSVQHLRLSIPPQADIPALIYEESAVQDTMTAASLFRYLDLRQLEAWEKQITSFTAFTSKLYSFLFQHLFPVLTAQARGPAVPPGQQNTVVVNQHQREEQEALASLVTQIRRQLDAYELTLLDH